MKDALRDLCLPVGLGPYYGRTPSAHSVIGSFPVFELLFVSAQMLPPEAACASRESDSGGAAFVWDEDGAGAPGATAPDTDNDAVASSCSPRGTMDCESEGSVHHSGPRSASALGRRNWMAVLLNAVGYGAHDSNGRLVR